MSVDFACTACKSSQRVSISSFSVCHYPSHFPLWLMKELLGVTTYHLLLSGLIQLKAFSIQLLKRSKPKSNHIISLFIPTSQPPPVTSYHYAKANPTSPLPSMKIWPLTTTLTFHLAPPCYPDTLTIVHFSSHISSSQALSLPGESHHHLSHQVISVVH